MRSSRPARALLTAAALAVVAAMHWPAADTHAAGDDKTREALNWWQDNARSGDPVAQYNLAKMYELGLPDLGIKRNPKAAFGWYRRAAAQGLAKAQYELGRAYEYGSGTRADRKRATDWYRRAAAQGHTGARERLRAGAADKAQTTPGVRGATTGHGASESRLRTGVASNAGQRYLPWWQGALALGGFTILFWLFIGTPLGVSSSWDRIARWREQRELDEAQRFARENQAAVEAAMRAAAVEQFGEDYVRRIEAEQQAANPPAPGNAGIPAPSTAPWHAHLSFLAMMAAGGLLASSLRGDFSLKFSLGEEFTRLFGFGWPAWVVLLLGGFLIGFGTRMSGGCTSGHGLSGCARLLPASLLGTAAFFGTAVAVSLLLEVKA